MKTFRIALFNPGEQKPADQATLRATYPGVAVKRFLDGGLNLRFGSVDPKFRKSLGKGQQVILFITRLD